jgi:hypothetical protein
MPGSLTVEQREYAGWLFAGDDAVLTGLPALRRHGLRYLPGEPDDRPVHTAIPHLRHRKSAGFAVVERTERLPNAVAIDGLPCASVARALVDATRRITVPAQTRAMVLEAVQRRKCGIDQIAHELKHAQRRGTALVGDAVREARSGVRSVPEGDLRLAMQGAPLPTPLWNPQVYRPDGTLLGIPDGLIVESMVALEVDSRAYHSEGDDWMDTLDRDSDFMAHGLLTVHVVPARLRRDPWATVRRIVAVHQQGLRRPRPELLVVPMSADGSYPSGGMGAAFPR